MKNIIVAFSFGFVGLALVLNGCGGERTGSNPSSGGQPVSKGAATFKRYCVTCHGADGTLGLNGAANMATSTLTKEEAIQVITNGRKMMAPYKTILSPDEIAQVADHVMTLRQ